MFYSKQYNQYISEGTAFTLGEIQYPANWLNCSSAAEKAEAGLVEVTVVGAPANDQYYWVSTTLDNGVLTYVNTPKELDVVKTTSINQTNATAYSLLAPSDWMVTKSIETQTPVAQDWTAFRASVRDVANNVKAMINESPDVDAVAGAMANIVWPHDPNYVEAKAEEETV